MTRNLELVMRHQGKSMAFDAYRAFLHRHGELVSDTRERGLRHELFRMKDGSTRMLVSNSPLEE